MIALSAKSRVRVEYGHAWSVEALETAGVPYGAYHAASSTLWLSDAAQGLFTDRERGVLRDCLHEAGSSASRWGGTIEPVFLPRVQIVTRPHPSLLRDITLLVFAPRPAAARNPSLERLSERERAVAELIASGESTKTIAATLGISAHTVRRHTEHVFSKLGVRSRAVVASLVVGGSPFAASPH